MDKNTIAKNTDIAAEATTKMIEEYVDLGVRLQDELFKMAQHQMTNFKEYSEFALKNQVDFFNQFEKNSKATRDLWVEGLKKWKTVVEKATPKA